MAHELVKRGGVVARPSDAGNAIRPGAVASALRLALHQVRGTMPSAHHIVRRRPRRRAMPPHASGALKPPSWYRRSMRRESRNAARDGAHLPPVAKTRLEYRMSVVGDLLVNAIARGVGQVAFANNPVSGAIILVALCWPLPYTYALLASIGLFASTGTALWLGLGRTALNNGLFTFNGVLVGQAAATFLVLDTTVQIVSACIAVAVFSAFAALLTQALGNLLVAHHKVRPRTQRHRAWIPLGLCMLTQRLFPPPLRTPGTSVHTSVQPGHSVPFALRR